MVGILRIFMEVGDAASSYCSCFASGLDSGYCYCGLEFSRAPPPGGGGRPRISRRMSGPSRLTAGVATAGVRVCRYWPRVKETVELELSSGKSDGLSWPVTEIQLRP